MSFSNNSSDSMKWVPRLVDFVCKHGVAACAFGAFISVFILLAMTLYVVTFNQGNISYNKAMLENHCVEMEENNENQ